MVFGPIHFILLGIMIYLLFKKKPVEEKYFNGDFETKYKKIYNQEILPLDDLRMKAAKEESRGFTINLICGLVCFYGLFLPLMLKINLVWCLMFLVPLPVMVWVATSIISRDEYLEECWKRILPRLINDFYPDVKYVHEAREMQETTIEEARELFKKVYMEVNKRGVRHSAFHISWQDAKAYSVNIYENQKGGIVFNGLVGWAKNNLKKIERKITVEAHKKSSLIDTELDVDKYIDIREAYTKEITESKIGLIPRSLLEFYAKVYKETGMNFVVKFDGNDIYFIFNVGDEKNLINGDEYEYKQYMFNNYCAILVMQETQRIIKEKWSW